jgi:hypothetical protein
LNATIAVLLRPVESPTVLRAVLTSTTNSNTPRSMWPCRTCSQIYALLPTTMNSTVVIKRTDVNSQTKRANDSMQQLSTPKPYPIIFCYSCITQVFKRLCRKEKPVRGAVRGFRGQLQRMQCLRRCRTQERAGRRTRSTDTDQTEWEDRNQWGCSWADSFLQLACGFCKFGRQDAYRKELPSKQTSSASRQRRTYILK